MSIDCDNLLTIRQKLLLVKRKSFIKKFKQQLE